MRRRVVGLVTLLAVLVQGGSGAQAPARPLVGISLNVPQGGTGPDLVRSVLAARSAGARLMYVSLKWSELEPSPGRVDVARLDKATGPLASLGFQECVTLQTLDTNNRTLPADLQGQSFDAPEVRERFAALLRQIAPHLPRSVRYVNLGNEADIYLGQHPGEVEAFAGFAEQGRQVFRSLRPDIAVGVTTTFGGLRDRPQIFRRLNAQMDVVTMTYYPLMPDFGVSPVSEVSGDFARMVSAAGSRPLLMQEVGYPASPTLGSSDTAQAAFVDAVFAALRLHAAHIGFVNFFLMYDFSGPLLDSLVGYYGVHDARFRAYLATLGLERADGTARPAWARFVEDTHRWTAPP